MELRKDLELIEVEYQNEKKKAVLTFLDVDKGQVLEVNFNKQSYDTDSKKFIDDKEKEEKVEEWCEKYFNTTFEGLSDCIGVRKDVYHYESFNSLWESEYAQKFDKNEVGQIFNCKITDVTDNGNMIQIFYKDLDTDVLYRTNMSYSNYIESREEWFVDPIKKDNVYKKFKNKFGVDIENGKDIIGKNIMVEVKLAFGQFTYGDIKKPNWSK